MNKAAPVRIRRRCEHSMNEYEEYYICEKCRIVVDRAEWDRLRSLCTRWYLPDGTFETLPEEEVTRRRIEAAGVLERAGQIEEIASVLYEAKNPNGNWSRAQGLTVRQYLVYARALSSFLSGGKG